MSEDECQGTYFRKGKSAQASSKLWPKNEKAERTDERDREKPWKGVMDPIVVSKR